MQTQGQNASSLWGGNSNLSGLESNWGSLSNQNSTGANFGLGLGSSTSLSNNTGHNMQSGASSSFGESLNTISTNAVLGNSSRMNFGAPGTLPPGHSAIKASSSVGNMQGSSSASGAQPNGPQSNQSGLLGASSQITGMPVSSQGSSAFGGNMGFQKISSSSGPAVNPGTSISSNAQNSDNLNSGWGMSSSNNSTLPGTSGWPGNPNSGSDWDQQSTNMSQSQQQIPQTSSTQFRNANPTGQPTATDNQRPSSWAQAAGKGLNLNSNNSAVGAAGNVKSPAEMQREAEIRKAIESHDGWGKKPVRQDTQWSIESSPKVQNKFSNQSVVPEQPQQQKGTNNMWNNNNGTAIWEANKENVPWNNNAVARPGPGPNAPSWSGPPQNPPNTTGNSWVTGPPGQPQISDKTIGSWGPQEGGQSAGSNWSSSTEIGSWGSTQSPQNSTASGGISTWGEQEGTSGWSEGQGRAGGGNGTAYWGEPPSSSAQQQQQWGNAVMGAVPNQPTAIGQRTKPPDDWNKPGGRSQSGWGEPGGPQDSKVDDGTGLWASNNQPQANAGQWGDNANQQQWSATVGKSRPNQQQPPANWGGVDDLNWNTPQEDIWSEESMKGWDDADMGTWNDSSLENNATWNSATGFNRNKRNSIKGGAAMKPLGGPPGHPQMRSRLLQQLMDLGFKKDEAQGALINNNMNIQSALSDLYNRKGAMVVGRKDGDMDMFQMEGTKPRIPGLPESGLHDDISDTPSDSNSSFVPNLNSMQNTPFNNAQSQIPNQFPFNKGPSLSQSSRNNPNTSINNLLQTKIIQKIHNQQPPPPTQSMNSINQTQGPGGRGQLPGGQNMQQQHMAQQQIIQQLQMAVQAGLISPALLNQQLPPQVLVMLQQLLQLQQMLQQLITAQQNLPQQKTGMNPAFHQRQQHENMARINTIRQQILGLQKKIAQAQKAILSNPDKLQQENSTDQSDSLVNKLSPDFSKVSISTTQPQSRLTQWKMPDKESDDDRQTDSATTETPTTTSSSEDSSSLNKAVGSKPIQQSQSTPNLRQNYNELGLNHLGGDTTWSTTPTSSSASLNWPNTSTPSSSASQGDSANTENKESQSTTTSSVLSQNNESIPAMSSIPEFVPGKPWQGMTRNPEDDPHITPGSFQRALSVNMVKDDYLTSLTKSSPTSDTTSTWPNAKPLSSMSQNLANKPWSPGGDTTAPSSGTSDVWGLPKGNMSRPPPGLPQQQKVGAGWTPVGRQHSWAGPSRSDVGSMNVSTSLVLKNLSQQMDGSVLRTLCMQHGPLQCFYLNTAQGQALVKYSTKEEAMKAQNSLNECQLGDSTILAEFISDTDAVRFIEQQNALSAPSQWSQSAQIGGNRQSAFGLPNQRTSDVGNWNMPSGSSGSSMWGHADSNVRGDSTGAGNLWGGMEDPHSVLGNIYG